MRKIVLLLAISMLFVPSCDIRLLEGAESSLNPPHEILDPPEGLTGYMIVDVSSVSEEGREVSLPPGFRNMNNLELVSALVPGLVDLVGGNHFANLLEALGIDVGTLFEDPDIFPGTRSVVASGQVHVEDEGVILTEGYDTKLSADIDYLDLVLNADSPAFMRFLFDAIDGHKWNYSPTRASLNGRLGLSAMLGLESELETASLSAYLDVEFYDVQIGSFDFEFDGSSFPLYFPDKGTIHLEAQASFADSIMVYEIEDTTSVGGLERPDGGGEVVMGQAYCPYVATLVVRETAYFDAQMLFDAIRRMATSSSLTGEAIWNTLSDYLWPGSTGPNITLTIHIPDIGDGSARVASASDWTLLQFLFRDRESL